MRHITRDIVSALIFSKDGKIFMGKKDPSKGGVYSDCWHIPGGGVDEGESMQDAVIREVQEETGIDISRYEIEKLDYQDSGDSEKILKDTGEKVMCHMTFTVYRILLEDLFAQDIPVHLSDDLVQYKWFGTSELATAKLTPPSVKLFIHLGFITETP